MLSSGALSTSWGASSEPFADKCRTLRAELGGLDGIAAALEVARAALAPCPPVERDPDTGKPIGDDVLGKCIASIGILPSAALDDESAALARKVYRVALADLPADLVREATLRALRTCKFRPSPAELRELVEPELKARAYRVWMLEKSATVAELAPPPPPVDFIRADEVAGILAEAGFKPEAPAPLVELPKRREWREPDPRRVGERVREALAMARERAAAAEAVGQGEPGKGAA